MDTIRGVCMIYEKIQKIQSQPVMEKILRFFDGNLYPLIYAALALICSFTGLEVAFFVLTAIVVVFTAIFSKDSKPLIAPLVLVVYSVSQKHTPQYPYNSDYLYRTSVLATMGVLLAFIAAAFVFRMIVYKGQKNIFKSKAIALWGTIAFGAALVLNGIFYKGYHYYDLLLGIALAVSFVFFYIYFYNTLEWNKETGIYVAKILIVACGVILIQLAEMLIFDGVIENGTINKHILNLGWGLSNNVGGMLAMFMPACFYLSYKADAGWKSGLYYAFGFVVLLGVALTLSRTSLLVGGVALVAIMILMSIRGRHVKMVRIFNIVLIACGIIFCIVFADKLVELFEHYIDKGFDDSSRFQIWKNGLLNFLKAPIFGVGFYTPIAPDWSYNIENWFFPDMYHNTIIQMIASCGVVGILAYIFHVAQGVVLMFRRFSIERLFYFFVVFVLSVMSLLDNHIFHFFPALVYSMLFAVAERDFENTPEKLKEQVL